VVLNAENGFSFFLLDGCIKSLICLRKLMFQNVHASVTIVTIGY
jgi:hypothetical protein